jgi:hypothetical protein
MIEAATITCKMCDQPLQGMRSVYCSNECVRQNERQYSRNHRATFSPARKRASSLVFEAVQRRKLVPQPCEVCGDTIETHAHHDDYAKPLEVRWLCRRCHKRHHAEHGPGKNA